MGVLRASLQSGLFNQSSSQVIDGSLKFDKSKGTYQKRTYTAGNRKTYTWSGWIKRSSNLSTNEFFFGGGPDGNNNTEQILFFFMPSGAFRITTGSIVFRETTQLFRDPSSFYHLVVTFDTTQSTASDRIKIYVNGSLVTSYTSQGDPGENANTGINAAVEHVLGKSPGSDYSADTYNFDGKLSQVNLIDGLALGPGYFGYTDPLTNTWRPKKFRAEGTTVNDGTVWSSGIPGNTLSGYPATNGFDGNTSNYVYADNGTTMTWTAPKKITGQLIEVYVYAGNIHPIVKVNGQSTGAVVGGTAQQNVWVDVTDLCGGPGGSLQTIQAFGETIGGVARSSGFAGVRVDGVIMKDSTTQNLAPDTVTILVGTPSYPSSFTSTGDKTSDQTGLSFGSWISGSYTGAATKIFKNSTNTTFTLNVSLVGGSNDRYLWGSNNLTNWTYVANASSTYYQLSGYKYYATSEGSASSTLHATGYGHNNFYLPMDGNSPIGDDKSNPNSINDGTTWSAGLTSNVGFYSGEGAEKAFNGDDSNYASVATGGASNYLNFTCNIPIRSSLRVKVSTGTNSVHINGSGSANVSGTGYLTVSSPPATLTQLRVYGSSGVGARIYAVEVDGVVLVDGNGWTPVNFGGSNSLEKATGAKPILNTDGGGNIARPGVFGSEENLFYKVTTANGSVYQFDITSGNNPSLSFIRGATYKFDYSSHTGHPLLFSTSNPDSSVSAYTDGTSIASNVISFTVPHNAPDTLYYYCSAHPTGMNGAISITTDETKADPYAWKCVLAAPLVGSANDVSSSVGGSDPKTITAVGGAAASSAQSNFYDGSFVFDGSGDALKSTSSGLAPGTSDFCCEAWFYYNALPSSSAYRLLGNVNAVANTTDWQLIHQTNGTLTLWTGSGHGSLGAAPLKAGCWNHIAYVRDNATHKLYVNGVQMTTTVTRSGHDLTFNGLDIGGRNDGAECINGYMQDVRFYIGTTKYTTNFIPASTSPDVLPDTPSGVSGGSKLTKVTDGAVSFDGTGDFLGLANTTDTNFGSGDFTVECFAYFKDVSGSHTLLGQWENGSNRRSWLLQVNSGQLNSYLSADGTSSGQKSIDSAAGAIGTNRWYHLTYARSGDTMRMFIDGILVGSVDVSGFTNYANTNDGFQVGSQKTSASNVMNGFISNARIIKGTALYTTSFNPPTRTLTNVTNTKLLCCQSNTSAIVAAVKPGTITANGNAAATNFNPFTTDIDAVRGQETGYCTLNPLDTTLGSNLQDGNLKTVGSSNWAVSHARGTFALTYGKWFWEGTKSGGGGAVGQFGFANSSANLSNNYGSSAPDSWTFYFGNGTEIIVPAANSGSYFTGGAMTDGDTAGVALDMDNGTWQFFKNGVGGAVKTLVDTDSASTVSITELYPFVGSYNSNFDLNFGQKPFKFPPPAGFQPINAANVRPETVITRPGQYFGATIWDGTGSARDIDIDTQPDLVWAKVRNHTYYNYLVDSVRGAGKELNSNTTDDEYTDTSNISAFNANGFSLGTGAGVNQSGGKKYVAWAWKAGGNKNTFNVDDVGYASAAAAGLDGGNINPNRASVGTKQGFSIIRYTGTDATSNTFSHGLTQKPDFAIFKNTSQNGDDWIVYHSSIGATKRLKLNSSNAADSQTSQFNDTEPTSSVFTIGTYDNINKLNNNYISYIWHNVPGLQKFGTFTGNGTQSYSSGANVNTNGPLVELGFEPALIIIKGQSAASDWSIFDQERCKLNYNDVALRANYTNGEIGNARGGVGEASQPQNYCVDILSNGFKIRATGGAVNYGSTGYIYAAWAKSPTFNLFGAQSNAF